MNLQQFVLKKSETFEDIFSNTTFLSVTKEELCDIHRNGVPLYFHNKDKENRITEIYDYPFTDIQYCFSFYLRREDDSTSLIGKIPLRFIEKAEELLLESPMIWGNLRKDTTVINEEHFLDQIRTRYAYFSRPINGLSNIIIDNYAPKLFHNTKFEATLVPTLKLPKTTYAISPWFADYFGAQQISTEQLCRVLGYDTKMLSNLILKVKRKEYTVTFVGYGGTVVNTVHWITEILKLTQQVNLFSKVEFFETDEAELSNLLRFPKNPHNAKNNLLYPRFRAHKLNLLNADELNLISRTTTKIHHSRIDGNNISRSDIGVTWNYDYDKYINNTRYKVKPKHVFYGAPDINTRQSFEPYGHFISATHNGNDAHLWLNPTQDVDLQVESYGLIQLTPFFMNQLRLAIGFLETLAIPNLDLKEKDKLLLEYTFDGVPKLKTNRVYNFQLGQHSGLMTTEIEANIQF